MSSDKHLVALLEDDPAQIESFAEELEERKPDTELITFLSEGEFRDYFARRPARFPDAFVLDLMVRWTRPGITVQTARGTGDPSDQAGLRCRDLILKHDPHAPIQIWTVIEIPPDLARSQGVVKKTTQRFDLIVARLLRARSSH